MRKKKNIKLDAVNLLDEIQNGKYSNIQMNYYFSRNEYSKKEREFITNIINVTLKNLIFVDYVLGQTVRNIQKRKIKQLLRISAAQILFMDSDNAGVVYEAGEISKIINKHQTGFVNATLQAIIKNKEEIINAIPEDKREGIIYSYPQWFVNKLKTDYPDDYTGIMKAYKERSYLSVRYNRKKLSKENFEKILSKIKSEVLFSADEVYYLSNGNILSTDEYKRGDIIIQDASSYIAVKNLNVSEEDTVLDACAAPGGKSLAILQTFTPKLLLATDIHEHKIEVMKKIKEKYANDKQMLNIKTMELYREHKVNPLGGCLPILIQLPILFALFGVLRSGIIPTDSSFLWMKLSEPDPFFILPVLNGAVSFLQQKLMGTSDNAQMKNMMYVFPIMMIVISYKMPSGLQLYWLTSSLIAVIQQYFIMKKGA